MGYQSAHRGSPRGSGQKFQKSQHEKAKTRAHRHRAKGAFSEEKNSDTAEIVVEKVVNNLKRLGEQKFAVSPFRQYFDDWLLNVKQAVSEFESSPAVIVDEEFVNAREQTFTKIEAELVKTKREEETLEPCVKELADTNHLLVKIDAEYAAKTRETATRRNIEIQRLTKNVRNLEAELERVKAIRTSFIGGVSKKAKALKMVETSAKLEEANAGLEKAIESFKAKQEKLHDGYEKSKQTAMAKVQMLEKEIEKLETDESLNARHEASEGLTKAVNALLERQPKPSNDSTS